MVHFQSKNKTFLIKKWYIILVKKLTELDLELSFSSRVDLTIVLSVVPMESNGRVSAVIS